MWKTAKVKLGINAPHSKKKYTVKKYLKPLNRKTREAAKADKDALSYLINRQKSE